MHDTRNYFIKGIEENELMNKKHKKVFTILNYIEHFLILASTVTECISISAFALYLVYSYRSDEFQKRFKNFCINCRN